MNVRPLSPDDDPAVRAVFRATLLLGDPLGLSGPTIDRYEALCLDWYLGPGRADAAVLLTPAGEVVGYALVCTDAGAHRRWVRREAARFAVRAALAVVMRRGSDAQRRFCRLRLLDGWTLWRAGTAAPLPAHAHINVLPPHRGGRAGRLLADHVDARVRQAGRPGWYGEINAIRGERSGALERLGARVVDRVPNRTLSTLVGRPVERLTVVRLLPPAHDVVPLDAA